MKNAKILVIDDDPMTCKLLETVLQMENFQTVSAHRIEDENILALIDAEKPQVVILDFHLGSRETIVYVEDIRADDKWRTLPILMTSGIDYREKCLEAGANDFMLKPFDWREVIKRINKLGVT